MSYLAKHGEDMNEERKSTKRKADSIRLSGIGPELAEFVTEFIEMPENFSSLTFERRREFEIRWMQFYPRLGNDKIYTNIPSNVLDRSICWIDY